MQANPRKLVIISQKGAIPKARKVLVSPQQRRQPHREVIRCLPISMKCRSALWLLDSLHVHLYPAVQEFSNIQAIFLDHYHVTVTPNTSVFESNEISLHACLVHPFRGAVIEHRVV